MRRKSRLYSPIALHCLGYLIFSIEMSHAQDAMDVIDFMVDARNLLGKRVTVTGCHIEGASIDYLQCHGPGTSGYFFIDSKTLEREALRQALRKCANFDDVANCIGDATGEVAPVFNDELGLKNAALRWKRR